MKVIIAIDQSVFRKQILDAVISRHWPKDTAFEILTVVEPVQFEAPAGSDLNAILKEIAERQHKMAEEYLHEARALLLKHIPDCTVHTCMREGSARHEIISAAVDYMPDKIVLGAHGNSPNRLVPGAVSRAVVQHVPCAVEIIRLRLPHAPEKEPVKAQKSLVK